MRFIEPAHRLEVPNERIFRLVCVESIVGDPSVEAPLHRRRSAIALVEAVFLRSISARALLYARTGPEMARETRALHRKLILPDRAGENRFLRARYSHMFNRQEHQPCLPFRDARSPQ